MCLVLCLGGLAGGLAAGEGAALLLFADTEPGDEADDEGGGDDGADRDAGDGALRELVGAGVGADVLNVGLRGYPRGAVALAADQGADLVVVAAAVAVGAPVLGGGAALLDGCQEGGGGGCRHDGLAVPPVALGAVAAAVAAISLGAKEEAGRRA